ncbi:MAG: hypothetical protein IPM46_14130 [Flavobacteriales bacterium]|nr:hypothetical protein [Flavobacteriales bacterium]
MKTLAALVMCLHICMASVAPGGLIELIKLPDLAEHYHQHALESDGDLTIVEFLMMHYFDAEHEKRDASRHGDLPFHHTTTIGLIYLATADPPGPTSIEASVASGYVPMELWACGQWPGRSVFHPPKLNG